MRKHFFPIGRTICLALVLALVYSCLQGDFLHFHDPVLFTGSPKGRNSTRGGASSKDEIKPEIPQGSTLYFSTVEFEPNYDWQQDSAFGNAHADLVLYRDFKEIKRVSCSKTISYEHDLHHIINGHIYTECCKDGKTYIGRDGEMVLEFDEALRLDGLVEKDGHIYTLCHPLSGKGLVFRQDKDVILRKVDGAVYGGFNMASYPDNGALYMDLSDIVFCYRVGNQAFLVTNGTESLVHSGTEQLIDCKRYNASCTKFIRGYNSFAWIEGQVWVGYGYYAASGTMLRQGKIGTWAYDFNYNTLVNFSTQGGVVYVGDGGMVCVRYINNTVRAVYLPYMAGRAEVDAWSEGKIIKPEGVFRFISEKTCALDGEKLYLGLSSAIPYGKPVIIADDKRVELDINGLISSISIVKESLK